MRSLSGRSGINRRRVLISMIGLPPLAALATVPSHAGAKVAQGAVYYQANPKNGQECAQCAQYLAPHACRLVDGDIAPTGWCRLWVKKAA